MRLQHFDYNWQNQFFITICAKNRKNLFGDVMEGQMQLSDYGKIAEECWLEIPNHHENVEIDEFIIMPDHMHAILCLESALNGHAHSEGAKPQHNRLSTIVGSFKSAVSKKIRIINPEIKQVWQKSFHDRLIKSHIHMAGIREYIKDNPKNWDK